MMSEETTTPVDQNAGATTETLSTEISASAPAPTPLASLAATAELTAFAGILTPAFFSSATEELSALTGAVGVYDLGWRARLRISGEDRVRWLNGMVTNTVKDLAPGSLNYTFLLNAQGRIQGDGEVYATPDALLFATDQAQAPKLLEHLDRFIIMDDVELQKEAGVTALGLAGPGAPALLAALGMPTLDLGAWTEQDGVLLARERSDAYVLWTTEAAVLALWERLLAAGALPCGIQAVESLRVLAGIPRYGADIQDKTLAQETGQTRALNFNKGCYLGQEIVERIRSRATVHKGLRVFRLEGDAPVAPATLFAESQPDTSVGELSSIAAAASGRALYALGTVRTEAALGPLVYQGGKAVVLAQPPLPTV